MKKKKKNNIFLKILGCLFILFIALFIANMSGYYEGKIRERVTVTKEGIKMFEQAVKNGDAIDIESFLNTENIDYSSKLSNVGDSLTYGLENFAAKGVGFVIDILKSLF